MRLILVVIAVLASMAMAINMGKEINIDQKLQSPLVKDTPLLNIVSNLIRPFYKHIDYAVTGLGVGFLGVDIKRPFYCVTDAIPSI